ncbi:MAG: NUDIX hydrolase [Candidatus Kapaibacteriota bacterium]
MPKNYLKLSEKSVCTNPYWEYKIDEYILPNRKKELYFYAHTPGSTMIIPRLDNKFILTLQFRYLNQKESLEFPGGGIKPGLSIVENAIEELTQETGYSSNKLKQIGSFNPCNGLTDEICYVFYTDNLVKTSQKLDETEEITVVYLSEKEIVHKIKNGEIWDGMTLASWCLFKSLQF